jgi:hypothetical protein
LAILISIPFRFQIATALSDFLHYVSGQSSKVLILRNTARHEPRHAASPQIKRPAVMHRIAHKLLRCSHILHHIRHARRLANPACALEQLDAQFGVGRIGVKMLLFSDSSDRSGELLA